MTANDYANIQLMIDVCIASALSVAATEIEMLESDLKSVIHDRVSEVANDVSRLQDAVADLERG